jgi:hypothetical protein
MLEVQIDTAQLFRMQEGILLYIDSLIILFVISDIDVGDCRSPSYLSASRAVGFTPAQGYNPGPLMNDIISIS